MWKLFLSALILSSCGSYLKTGEAPATQRNDQNTVFALADGAEMTVTEYQLKNNLTHVLLIFGSEFCLACKEKNIQIRDSIYGKHPIFGNKNFDIVGVSVDETIEDANAYVQKQHFNFIKLWDKEARYLVSAYYDGHFDWGTPTTVLLSGEDVIFKYTYHDKQDLIKILDQAQHLIGN